MSVLVDAGLAEGLGDSLAAAPREWTDVLREVDGLRADFARRLRYLALGPAAADDELGPTITQGGVQVCQAVEQELRARARRVAPVQKPVVEAEHGHDPLVGVERGAKSRVIAQPKIAAKPDQAGLRGGHVAPLPGCAYTTRATR